LGNSRIFLVAFIWQIVIWIQEIQDKIVNIKLLMIMPEKGQTITGLSEGVGVKSTETFE